jgi:hypothetical protein
MRIGRMLGLVVVAGVAAWWLVELATRPDLRIPFDDLPSWLAVAPPEIALTALAYHVAVAALAWLAVASAVYGAAGALRLRRLHALAGALCPPAMRRAVDAAVAAAVTAAVVVTPVAATAGEEGPAHPPGAPVAAGVVPPGTAHAGFAPDAPCRCIAAESEPAGRRYLVQPGDNLWSIAAADLRERDPAAEPAEIARYWRRVVAHNAASIRSGDPDLIFPGETIVLPDW